MKINYPFILASQSPRRKELLENMGLKFTAVPSTFEEVEEADTPEELAVYNAEGKAAQVAENHPNSIILGVDTIGSLDHHILTKPKDPEDAFRILKLLSGSTHQVISAISLINTATGKQISRTSTTDVTIDQLTDEQIHAYINSGEGRDKAASYAIQGLGSLFVKEIKGDYFNVVGLPINLYKSS